MFIFQNPKNNEISIFSDLSQVGMGFANWINITDTEEAESYLLSNAKQAKIAELENYYASSECWLFQVKSTQLGASITKDADWFAKMLPAINGLFFLLTDAGVSMQVNLTAEQARLINSKINVEISLSINTQKRLCREAIENTETIEDVEAIDVKSYLGDIPRIFEIDNII
jgi:hypothetical protein